MSSSWIQKFDYAIAEHQGANCTVPVSETRRCEWTTVGGCLVALLISPLQCLRLTFSPIMLVVVPLILLIPVGIHSVYRVFTDPFPAT